VRAALKLFHVAEFELWHDIHPDCGTAPPYAARSRHCVAAGGQAEAALASSRDAGEGGKSRLNGRLRSRIWPMHRTGAEFAPEARRYALP